MREAPERVWLGKDTRYVGGPWIRLTDEFDEETAVAGYVRDDLCEALQAKLDVATEALAWRDIATAPKDGTWFLACATAKGWGATRIVRYADCYDRLPIHGEGEIWPSPPTHWMPLPAPPVTP